MSQVRVFNYISVESACPLCGSDDTLRVVEIDSLYSVRCGACWIHGPMDKCGTVAVEKWNALSGQDETIVNDPFIKRCCPNPKCGSDDVVLRAIPIARQTVWRIACQKCRLQGPLHSVQCEAVHAWNSLPRIDGEQERIYNPTLDMNNCLNQECGQEPVLIERDGFCLVQCNGCFMCGPLDKDVYRAVEKWNALSESPSQECANESQVEELDGVNYCPMCGECPDVQVDWWPSGGSSAQVSCECGMQGLIGLSEQEAIEYWNMLSGSDGGWISVEDRLPEPRATVLVRVIEENEPQVAYLQDDYKTWYVQPLITVWYKTVEMVTHWQPLPSLPAVCNRESTEQEQVPNTQQAKALLDWLATGLDAWREILGEEKD